MGKLIDLFVVGGDRGQDRAAEVGVIKALLCGVEGFFEQVGGILGIIRRDQDGVVVLGQVAVFLHGIEDVIDRLAEACALVDFLHELCGGVIHRVDADGSAIAIEGDLDTAVAFDQHGGTDLVGVDQDQGEDHAENNQK